MDKDLVNKLLGIAMNLFKTKALPAIEAAATKEVAKPVAQIPVHIEANPAQPAVLDWSNPKSRLSVNFSVNEALFLPSWGASHIPSEEEKVAIKGIAEKVTSAIDVISKEIGKPAHVSVHAWMRPEHANIPGTPWNGMDYNRYIYETQVWKGLSEQEKAAKKVPNSPHKTGHAIDFHVVGYEGKEGCAKIRTMLIPHLESLGLRMEDITGGWVHLDDLPVKVNRFFKP